MFRLIYLSRAAGDSAPPHVAGIIAHARQRNAALGVSGLLAYNGRNFMQVLEGERTVVERLLATIRDDPRHRDLTVLLEEDGVERAFPDWAMQPLDLGDDIRTRRAQLEPLLPPALTPRARAILLSITTFG